MLENSETAEALKARRDRTLRKKNYFAGVIEFSAISRSDDNSAVGTERFPVGGFYPVNRPRLSQLSINAAECSDEFLRLCTGKNVQLDYRNVW